ncbi:MAG: ELM1/GtrOC1 family putative glycosyltransferase [Halioglobus sp.]
MGAGSITVWCLLGRKAGDNTQVLALAEELGWGYVEKHICARPWELWCHLGSGVTLAGIDRARSSALEAPWPDVVISAGRRNEPVARWIQRQSGGRSRLVHIGRPWAALSSWDLVITTPQYFLPEQANTVHNSLPLHRVSPEAGQQAAQQWRARFAHLPRPWVGVLLGGDSGRFVMTADKGRRLGALAGELAGAAGGSVLATDSPRTPRAAGDALQAQLPEPHFCYRWGSGTDNPYRGLLALADAFVVTGESMSMLGEAADTGRPLFIFDVGDGAARWWRLAHNYRYKPLSHRLAMRFAPTRLRRDVGNIQNALVGAGRAQWLVPAMLPAAARALRAGIDRSPPNRAAGSVATEELQRAARAVRRLVIPH